MKINSLTISPYNNEPGYLCLPLIRNIPTPRNRNWEKIRCPSCGSLCWLSLAAKVTMKQSNGKLQGVCTECALRAGMKAGNRKQQSNKPRNNQPKNNKQQNKKPKNDKEG